MTQLTTSDAAKATRPRRKPGSSQGPGLVKGEASHLSGRQTDYRRKDGRRNHADMGEGGSRLDGHRGELSQPDFSNVTQGLTYKRGHEGGSREPEEIHR